MVITEHLKIHGVSAPHQAYQIVIVIILPGPGIPLVGILPGKYRQVPA
jgi:hypothetical protein